MALGMYMDKEMLLVAIDIDWLRLERLYHKSLEDASGEMWENVFEAKDFKRVGWTVFYGEPDKVTRETCRHAVREVFEKCKWLRSVYIDITVGVFKGIESLSSKS